MAGEIRHAWHGTVLTITSDSGTSSCDLRGKQGDIGIRGPQGRCGVIVNEDGSIDYGGYATEAYVDYKIDNLDVSASVDLGNYYTKDEIDATLAEFVPSGGGGGGGGSSNNAVLTLTNTNEWLYTTIAENTDCIINATWSSLENDMETGSGILKVLFNGIMKYTANVVQGNFSFNAKPYLTTGSNQIKVIVSDVYGNTKSIIYTANVVSLKLTSTFDASKPYDGAINYTYIPTASVDKVVHFIVDNVDIGTQEVKTSGRQQTYVIPRQKHGSHTLEVYYEATIEGVPVESNHLYYDLICVWENNHIPIIASVFNRTEITQYETISIKYYVYDPDELTPTITLKANGEVVNEIAVDRTEQTWAYRADNVGDLTLEIICGGTTKTFNLTVADSEIDVEPVTDSLDLYLSSYGRSNGETSPNNWTYNDISCSFENYNWNTDGWQIDDDDITVHRVTGDARLTIPLQIFKNDFRTTGKTIEFEFATRDVLNYDAEIVSCFNDNIGFKLTAQKALLKSEQSEIGTQYKEGEHIRLSFVVEKKAENRLIYIYLNGIMCGVTQYPEDDDFTQGVPQYIKIGSNECTIDLYAIRVYSNNLTRYEILDNWIADTQKIDEKLDRYTRNNVYDAYGSIVVENLPNNLPYLLLEADVLPQYKGNKVSVSGEYINKLDATKSFAFDNATADVQGTSSAGYVRKNYKIKFPRNYKMRADSVATDTFTFKADVASSEGANNVELVRLYNAVCPYKTPPQEVDACIRQGIDGFPIVIFHNDGTKTEFIGKYNFNNDKGTPEVYGFTTGDESWEILNNTSNRVLFKSADFSTNDWKNDFEGRYPDKNTDITRLSAFVEWVASTENDLDKFKAELSDWVEVDSALFYYLFTELFLMVDSRAKNAFPSWVGGDKVCWLPYDMDTAIGTNNEGALVFGYELEDIDTTSTGADVYNGQQSVFWKNLRLAYADELAEMYQTLRSENKLSYNIVEKMFEEHQSVWPEAIWNEDAYFKYIQPLVDDGASIYLSMLQGNKEEQRKWWLYNRFKYIDSKYNAGDSLTDFITLRGYAVGDITVEPYADIYASVKYGSYLVQERALRGDEYTLECPLDNLNDTEIYVYSASQLKNIGDLSSLKVGLADFSMATRLQSLKIGDESADYVNNNLNELTLGNNPLLHTIDVRNCPVLGTGTQQDLDLSGCANIEHIYLTGTSLKGVKLPNGGMLKTLHLPNTVSNLTILNQSALADFVLNDYSNISTLRLENTTVDELSILKGMKENGRVRLTNIDWTFTDPDECYNLFIKLGTMRGLDENGNNMDVAQLSGTVVVPIECNEYVDGWLYKYPNLTIISVVPTLESCSWDYIAQVSANGMASSYWKVGDEKTVTLSTGETITLVIYGFNHDDLADGSGKVGITFGMKDCLETAYIMGVANNSNPGIWRYTTMRQTTLPNIETKLPSELRSVMKSVTKNTPTSPKDSSNDAITTKLFLFSNTEVMGTTYRDIDNVIGYGYGAQYEYFANAPIPEGFEGLHGDTGTFFCEETTKFTDRFGAERTVPAYYYYNYNAVKNHDWWTRTPADYNLTGVTGHFVYMNSGGSTRNASYTTQSWVSFGLCV